MLVLRRGPPNRSFAANARWSRPRTGSVQDEAFIGRHTQTDQKPATSGQLSRVQRTPAQRQYSECGQFNVSIVGGNDLAGNHGRGSFQVLNAETVSDGPCMLAELRRWLRQTGTTVIKTEARVKDLSSRLAVGNGEG